MDYLFLAQCFRVFLCNTHAKNHKNPNKYQENIFEKNKKTPNNIFVNGFKIL